MLVSLNEGAKSWDDWVKWADGARLQANKSTNQIAQMVLEEKAILPDKVKYITKDFVTERENIKREAPLYHKDFVFDKKHMDEVEHGNWLLQNFNGVLENLPEYDNQLNQDYLWDDKLWDLKNLETNKYGTIDKRIRHGFEQIEANAGGLLIDYTKSSLSLDEAVELSARSLETRVKAGTKAIIKKDNTFVVLEVKK